MLRTPRFWLAVSVMVGLCAGLFVIVRDVGYRAGFQDGYDAANHAYLQLLKELGDKR